jgi:tetratricopeptide (TPR) repeat protein
MTATLAPSKVARHAFIALGVLSILMMAVWGIPAYRVKRLTSQAGQAEQEKNYYLAITLWTSLLEIKPKSAPAFTGRGIDYAHLGKYDRAIADYNEAIRADPKNAAAYYSRGIAFTHEGNTDKALEDYNTALRFDPKYAPAYNGLGMICSDQGKHDEAIENYNKAMSSDPKYAPAHYNLGNEYMDMSQLDKAIEEYGEAIKRNPNYFAAYINRSHCYRAKGDLAHVIEDYKRSVEIFPNSPMGLNGLAWAYATAPNPEIRDGAKAMQLATKACELTKWGDDNIILTLAAAEAEAGNFDEAVKYQQQAIDMLKARHSNTARMESRLALYQDHKPYRQPEK